MSYPSLDQFISHKQGSGRKAAKKSWWKISRPKVSDEEKRRRRFEGDTRPYSERNAGHRSNANFLSYFFQLVSISGAVYGAYRMFWDWSIMGGLMLAFSLIVLWQYERLARWTSDRFWDERAAGRYDLKFAFLNFGVIWTIGLALTIGGAYFLLNDVQPDPDGSISATDPAYVQMQTEVKNARLDVKRAEKRVADFKKDRNNLCKDNGKWVVCHRMLKALSQLDGAIATAENRVSDATAQMSARFGSIKVLDDRATAYHLTVVDSRFYVQIGLFLVCLILFEVCMWYRSKYDMMLFWEEEYARAYGRKPKGSTKMDKAQKRRGAKKPSPRPVIESGVTVTPSSQPVTRALEPVTTNLQPVNIEPLNVPEGYRICALNGCTNLVTGKKKFCSESHRVTSYRRGRVAG